MITRVFHGRSAYGLVKYLYGDGRRNEHTDPHTIASWDGDPAGLEPKYVAALGMHRVAPLVRTLEQPVRVCERAPQQHVYHLVLRNDQQDRILSDDEWAEVCTAAMDETGIAPAGDPAGCRWVAVRHAADHVHLVATLAREDGRPPRIWGDYAKLGRVAERYEQRFGLRSTAGLRDKTARARPGVKEQVTVERAGRRISPRVTLRHKVQAAVASSRNFDEFTARLANDAVTVWPRMSERAPDQMTGYSVSLDDWTNAAGEPVRFGGAKLAPDLSWPKLRARWTTDEATTNGASPPLSPPGRPSTGPADAPDDTRGPRHLGPLTGEDADRAWREAERIVHEAADRIRAEARANPSAAADAAWAASDTLTAAAFGVEGQSGGALTDAAEAFDRAGREVNLRTPAPTDTGTALRATGRMVALLAAGNHHPAARIAALTIALASLTAAVADLRSAQNRAHQAAAARTAAEQLRAIAAAPSPSPSAARDRSRTAADVAGLSTGGAKFRPAAPKPETRRAGPPQDAARRSPRHQSDGPRHSL